MPRTRFRGCLLGGAIGDALGMPIERVTREAILQAFPEGIETFADPLEGAPCREFGLSKGMYTDDTQAIRAITQAIVRHGQASPHVVAKALRGWYLEGSLGQTPRYPGVTMATAMEEYRRTGDPLRSGVSTSTCGAAIRVAPIALWAAGADQTDFRELVKAASRVTHTGPVALDGALLVAEVLRSGLRNERITIPQLVGLCESGKMRAAMRRVESHLGLRSLSENVLEDLGGSTRADAVVPMAIYLAETSDYRFEVALRKGLKTLHPAGADMDSILALAGSMCGVNRPALVTESAWLHELEDSFTIEREADSLYECSTQREAIG